MDKVLFNLGGWSVTWEFVALTGFIVFAGLLVTVLVVLMRSSRLRIEEAAHVAAEGLRTNFVQQLAERDTRILDLDTQLNRLRQANTNLQAEGAGLKAQMGEQTKQAAENLQRFQKARQQMTDEFKAIAGEVLKSHGETFSKQNREQVDTLLKPLSDKIVEFQTGLLKDRAAMGESIRALVESNQLITEEASNLTRALKGNSQTQGAWGEMILSTILEQSGLREGEQFITQQSHSTDTGRVRTDVEIMMPNGDKLVIDSKVSLTAFEAYTNATDDDERDQQLNAHVASVRTHIKTLSGKDYHRHAGSRVDYVMMFVPIEAALAAASNADPNLIQYGMGQGVALTTPTTLMTILRTVRNVWDIEKRHQNAEEIADRAGSLFDKVSGFLGNMDKLDKSLHAAQKNFDDAKGQLSTGRGSVVRQVELLRELGAKTTRQLPAGWENDGESLPAPRLVVSEDDNEDDQNGSEQS